MTAPASCNALALSHVQLDMLGPMAQRVCQLALASSPAIGTAIFLEGADRLAVSICPQHTLAGQLTTRLDAFVRACRDADRKPHSPGASPLSATDPKHGGFLAFALRHDGISLGVLAFALTLEDPEQTDIDQTEHAATCANISAMASIMLAEAASNHQLQADLTDVTAYAQRLKRISDTDQLTGVDNKAAFENKCKARLTNDMRPTALLALDLDDFKQVNDVHGHLFGDTYLKAIADALKSELPASSIIGRMGGDEFCVLLEMPERGREYLKSVVHHLRLGLRRRAAVLGKPNLGGLSIGVSLFPSQAKTFNALWRNADCALYASKRTEREILTVYSDEMDGLMEPSEHDTSKPGFKIEEITTHFQPIVDAQTLQPKGLEVLARWRDRTGVLRTPDSFLWIFRDHRFATQVTSHVVSTALEQLCLAALIPAGDLPDLWVNVTESDLLDADFVFDVQSILVQYQVPWSKVVIEIHENFMTDGDNSFVRNTLQEIRRRGGRVALDDFGAGRTGLAHICNWPIDIVKIDRSIILKYGHEKGTKAIFDALVLVCDQMGLTVVAEGIETDAHLDLVRKSGCDLAQGFGLTRPASAEDLVRHKRLESRDMALA